MHPITKQLQVCIHIFRMDSPHRLTHVLRLHDAASAWEGGIDRGGGEQHPVAIIWSSLAENPRAAQLPRSSKWERRSSSAPGCEHTSTSSSSTPEPTLFPAPILPVGLHKSNPRRSCPTKRITRSETLATAAFPLNESTSAYLADPRLPPRQRHPALLECIPSPCSKRRSVTLHDTTPVSASPALSTARRASGGHHAWKAAVHMDAPPSIPDQPAA